GYAFTYSIDSKDDLIEYVKNQESHHDKKSFIEELKELLMEHEKARIFHEGVQKVHFFMKYAG
ncbi:MAG: hypothetical protein U9Q77_11985, partial [Candidatus Marinimicrobia bacterium]|nr:hypothetical protein [Candidatus Neomarinimicrobiota bacterium]